MGSFSSLEFGKLTESRSEESERLCSTTTGRGTRGGAHAVPQPAAAGCVYGFL